MCNTLACEAPLGPEFAGVGNRKRGQANFYSFPVGAVTDFDRSKTIYNTAVGDRLAWDVGAGPCRDQVWDWRDVKIPGIFQIYMLMNFRKNSPLLYCVYHCAFLRYPCPFQPQFLGNLFFIRHQKR